MGRRRRIWLLLAFFTVLWGVQVGRLWHWQVAEGQALARRAAAQRMRALELAPRGLILDREGVPLTDARLRWGVAVFPGLVRDPSAVAALLAGLTGEPAAQWETVLAGREGPGPFWAVQDLPEETARAAASRGLAGVVALPHVARYGPGALARHVVGYVNRAGGQLGLEAAYQDVLAGDAAPVVTAFVDGNGRPLRGLGVRAVEAVPAGKPPLSLRLTLDRRVQQVVEDVLDGWPPPVPGKPLRAAVVLLDASSGDILAMASRPQFDPEAPPLDPASAGARWAPLLNRAVSPYPPGSVFKPVVAAAALQEKRVTPDERFVCSGTYRLGDRVFTDPQPGGHGAPDLAGALAASCNITFIRIGYERLGAGRILDAARRFGFGRPSGIGLREESGGSLPSPQFAGEVAQLAFGQGPLVTPLQLARAYAAFVRDGMLPPTRLVDAVLGPDGTAVQQGPRASAGRATEPWVARIIARDLEGVTDPRGSGTGIAAWVPGWGSAGKTGSAEAVVDGRHVVHSWFAGWTPLSRPRYVMAVLVEDGGAGGGNAARLFREVFVRLKAGPRGGPEAGSRP